MDDLTGYTLAVLANAADLIARNGCARSVDCRAAGLIRDDWCGACVAQDALDCVAAWGTNKDHKPNPPQRSIRPVRQLTPRSGRCTGPGRLYPTPRF